MGKTKGRAFAPANVYYTLAVGLSGVVYAGFYAVADRIAASHGQGTAGIGYYASLYAVGVLCSTLAAGVVADRLGKPRVLRAALAVLAAGCFVLAFAAWAGFVLAGIFCLGMGAGCNEVQSGAYLTEINPGQETRWMNISQILFCVGAIGAPVAAVWVSSHSPWGYRGLMALLGGLAVLAGLVSLWVKRPLARAPRARAAHPLNLFSVLAKPRFVLVCVMVFVYAGYESVSIAFLKPLFLLRGLGEAEGAAAISVFWLCMIAARLAGSFLTGRERGSVLLFTLLAVAGFGVLLAARTAPVLFLGAAMVGAGCGPVWPMLFAVGGGLHPGRSGAAFAVMSLFSSGGGVLFPTLIGSWPDNLAVSFALCGALALLVAALALLGGRRANLWRGKPE